MPDKPPSLRARHAQRTQEEILAAARRLFAERGYARTSVRDIAAAAGVSAQTVYDSVGSKQALVARLNDLIDEEAGIGAIVAASMTAGDARPRRGRPRRPSPGTPAGGRRAPAGTRAPARGRAAPPAAR